MSDKILIVTVMPEYGETGVQTHFNMFKQYLLEKGVEVVFINHDLFYWWLIKLVYKVNQLINKLSLEFGLWWTRHWQYVFLKRVLADQLRKESSVILYVQCPISAKAALETRRSCEQKVIMVTHFNVSQADEWVNRGIIKKGGWVYQGIKQLEDETIPLIDGIVYVSEFMKETLESNMPKVTKVRSVVLPSFINKPNQLDLVQNKDDLINIGTLEPRKNQAYLLYILSEAKKLGKLYSLTLVGDGQDRNKLETLAKSLGIDGQVKFMGFQKDAIQFLPSHRVYVHSSLMESLGIALIEALAYGLPVLAAAVGGIPEIFSDGVEGLYWPLDNPTTAAEKLIALMEDTVKINRMAKAAQLRFINNFESNTVANRLLSFLREDSATCENATSNSRNYA